MRNTFKDLDFKRIDPYHSVLYLTEDCSFAMAVLKGSELGKLLNVGSVSAGFANPSASNNLSTFVYEDDQFTYVINQINSYDHTVYAGIRYDKVVTEA
jgi:hypothetical protein